MKLMVIPIGRSLVFELQLSQTLRPILICWASCKVREHRYFKNLISGEKNILGNVGLSPPAEEEDILASVALPYVVTLGHQIPPFLYPSLW
jgi:hypothetical protein